MPPTPRPLSTGDEALAALEQVLPQDIRERYLVGPMWNEMVQETRGRTLDTLIQGSVGPRPARLYLAAYLMNIVAEGLASERTFKIRIDPVTRVEICLNPEEITAISKAVKDLIAFIRVQLGVPLAPEPPHVRLG